MTIPWNQEDAERLKLRSYDTVTVCDQCRCACCWLGELMCQEAKGAGTVEVTIFELLREDREDPTYWRKLREAEGLR